MKLDYLLLPSLTVDIRRPVVDIKMEGIPEVGISCLVDSGALHNRFDENGIMTGNGQRLHCLSASILGTPPYASYMNGTATFNSWGKRVSFVGLMFVSMQPTSILR